MAPMKDKNLSKKRKAAALILAIGEENAAKILKMLNEYELHALSNEMAALGELSPKEIDEIAREFLRELGEEHTIGVGIDNIKSILEKAFGKEKAEELIKKVGTPLSKQPFYTLMNVDPKMIANFIKSEHPQTIAVILAHLEPQQAAKTLSFLPEQLQAEVIYRIAKLETVSPEVVKELEDALEEEVRSAGGTESHQVGGIEPVAEIMNNVPKEIEEKIMAAIEEKDEELAEEIKKKMFVFEDLIYVDDRGIQTILKEVSNEDLLLALKAASDEVKEKIFSNMSKRAAEMIKEDLETLGPVRLSDVEQAQQNILQVARKLAEEGKIVIAKGGGEVVV